MKTLNLTFNSRRLPQAIRECKCPAKRYVPAGKQRKGGPGGGSRPGGPARKPSRGDEGEGVADTDELLRELNSGGAGWLRDEEEADWGLDDVAEHARARQQRQALTGGDGAGDAGPSAPNADGDPASGPLRGRRRRGGNMSAAALELEQGGSPLASGLARITSSGPEDASEAAGVAGIQQAQWVEEWVVGGGAGPARGTGGVGAGVGAGAAGAPGAPGLANAGSIAAAATAVTAMELEESYARKNPELVEALQLQGIKIRVRRSEGEYGDLDEILEGTAAAAAAAALDEDDEFGSDLDLDLGLQTDLAEPDDSRGKAKGGGGGGTDWYSSLAAAGFSVRTSATGEVFLERTTTKRKPAAASAAPPAAAAAAAPGNAAAPAATTTAAARSAQKQQVVAAVAAAGTATASSSAAGSPAAAATPAEAAAVAARQLLPPLVGRPAVAAALKLLSTPQQVLDFLELAYPQWAANGFRLLDQRSGRPIPTAPSPSEAAHCLHALALTARRSDIGGWRCLDVAAGRQAQGLAECLRATPPRTLQSDAATAQLSAQMFDAARRYWLTDPHPLAAAAAAPATVAAGAAGGAAAAAAAAAASVLPMLDNPRAKGLVFDTEDRPTATGSSSSAAAIAEVAAATDSGGVSTAAALDDAEFDAELEALASQLQQQPGSSGSSTPSGGTGEDASYQTLAAKYAILSERKKRREEAIAALRQANEQQLQRAKPALNGHAPSGAAAVAAADKAVAAVVEPRASPAAAPGGAAARAQAARAAKVAEAATAAAERWLVKVDCLVAALWGMSTLGGTPYFAAETEALLAILVRCLASASAAAAGASAASAAAATAAAAAAGQAGASSSTSGSGIPASLAGAGSLGGWQAGQVLWALGNSRHVTPRLPDLEAAMIKAGGLSAMSPRDVTRVLWGFASLGHTPTALLLSIRPDWSWREQQPGATEQEEQGKRRGKGKKSKAKSGRGGDVRDFSPQQLAGVVWALAAMRQVDTVPFRAAWAQLLRRATEVPPAEPVLTQVWQANLALHLESEDASLRAAAAASASSSRSATISLNPNTSAAAKRRGGAGPSGPSAEDLTAVGLAAAASAPTASSTSSSSPSSSTSAPTGLDAAAARALLLRARDVFLSATSGLRRRVQSGYQRQMANALTAMRHMHLLEDNSAGYSIDITLPALRIALEADGPTHTSRTPGGAMLGATAMKRRHLQRLGWQVVNVTYTEWDKLSSDAARRAFLQERINQALVNSLDVGDEL